MSTMWLTEYRAVQAHEFSGGGGVPVPLEPSLGTQVVPFSGTAGVTGVLDNRTRYVRIVTDADAHLRVGADPVAVTGDQRIVADAEYWRGVDRHGLKVSVVAAAG